MRGVVRIASRVALVASSILFATLVAPAAPAPAPVAPAPAHVVGPRLSQVYVVEALGDSVPSGTRCDCTPFPERSATRLGSAAGHAVVAYNDAVAGLTTDGVLRQLFGSPTVMAHVRAAQVVEVEIGANDVSYTPRCGTSDACYDAALTLVRDNLEAIVARIRSLTVGRPVAIVLLGYWDVWLDGTVAAARGSSFVATGRWLTDVENSTIALLAQDTGSAYVDLVRVFRGTDDHDDTALLSSDGDHPNATGHGLVAQAVVDELLRDLPE